MGFTVESVDKTMEFLMNKGIKSIAGPYQPNPMLKFIYINDPNGVKIQLVENIHR